MISNEIDGLRALFDHIPQSAVDEIFAVDWASRDGSIEFLEERGIKVLRQDKKGRGEAFRLAFQEARGDAIIFFSPDGNEDPKDIPRFLPYLEQGYDLVIGNRMSGGGRNEEDSQFLKLRKWANQAFTLIANIAWNRSRYVNDTINGFRAIRRDSWERLALDGEGYTIEYQSSIRAMKLRLRIAEFPTYESCRINEREGSPSIPTGIAFLKLFFKELLPLK